MAPYRPHKDLEAAPLLDGDTQVDGLNLASSLQDHEYHEISDEEANNSPSFLPPDLSKFPYLECWTIKIVVLYTNVCNYK